MTLSVQALDGVYGRPAVGVRARLEQPVDGQWATIAVAETDAEGSIGDFAAGTLGRGPYRLVFESDPYFSGLGVSAGYPEIGIVFRIRERPHECRIQVLMTPHSYSMYFGGKA
ncbi:hydroxyisourate hydrolase [Actinoplanes sp. TFC3]|uniref:hydroxyisourate hydrolase n=1 Tax=Actinoplanes sp. TFC3 TaxID=1710355 RepID=UPI00082EB214|nr:hydroxyisourate hydrolase [Actinoplanes sp. TFC3]